MPNFSRNIGVGQQNLILKDTCTQNFERGISKWVPWENPIELAASGKTIGKLVQSCILKLY